MRNFFRAPKISQPVLGFVISAFFLALSSFAFWISESPSKHPTPTWRVAFFFLSQPLMVVFFIALFVALKRWVFSSTGLMAGQAQARHWIPIVTGLLLGIVAGLLYAVWYGARLEQGINLPEISKKICYCAFNMARMLGVDYSNDGARDRLRSVKVFFPFMGGVVGALLGGVLAGFLLFKRRYGSTPKS